jgi:hypothetical protein
VKSKRKTTTDTERLNYLEEHVFTGRSGETVFIGFVVGIDRPSATLRIAIDRAIAEEMKRHA